MPRAPLLLADRAGFRLVQESERRLMKGVPIPPIPFRAGGVPSSSVNKTLRAGYSPKRPTRHGSISCVPGDTGRDRASLVGLAVFRARLAGCVELHPSHAWAQALAFLRSAGPMCLAGFRPKGSFLLLEK